MRFLFNWCCTVLGCIITPATLLQHDIKPQPVNGDVSYGEILYIIILAIFDELFTGYSYGLNSSEDFTFHLTVGLYMYRRLLF